MSEFTLKLSLDDLKELFSGDDPPSVTFRTGIAKEIISLYIKTAVSNELLATQGKLIRDEIDAIMRNGFLDFDAWGKVVKAKLPQQYKDSIQLAVNEEIDIYIQEKCAAANKALAQHLATLPTILKNHVEAALDERKIQEAINKYIDLNITAAIINSLAQKAVQLQENK